ncbi:sporulation integral membrane protein YtvI [Virgibacillus halophilus]|uniref:Sporulation integral membrane protein YtvI n=1 Tax=Tigheibacillus halophilus TaxID=361280 RepID=A0ABU5CC96_9BACI|nr:sporulation integral membrane protein YtvI [Virgibacillus halophilus]
MADRMPLYFESGVALFSDFVHEHLIPLYERISALFQRLHPAQQDTIEQYLQGASSYAASYGASLLQQFFLKLAGFAVVLPSSISVTLFTVLATFFITNDYEAVIKRIKRFFPSKLHRHAKSLSSHFKRGMTGYAKAQLLLVMTSAVIIFAGLLILQIEHAMTITLLAAFADLLPLFGTGIIFIPWVIYLLFAQKLTLAAALALLYLFVLLTRQIMEPKVLSSSLGISPLLSLTVLFVAIKLYGGYGLVNDPDCIDFNNWNNPSRNPKISL